MQAVECHWNHDGSILAVAGIQSESNDRESNVVKFYSANGVVRIGCLIFK